MSLDKEKRELIVKRLKEVSAASGTGYATAHIIG